MSPLDSFQISSIFSWCVAQNISIFTVVFTERVIEHTKDSEETKPITVNSIIYPLKPSMPLKSKHYFYYFFLN